MVEKCSRHYGDKNRIFGRQEWNVSCVGDQISHMTFKYYVYVMPAAL